MSQKVSDNQIQNLVFYRPEILIFFSENQCFVSHVLEIHEISTPFFSEPSILMSKTKSQIHLRLNIEKFSSSLVFYRPEFKLFLDSYLQLFLIFLKKIYCSWSFLWKDVIFFSNVSFISNVIKKLFRKCILQTRKREWSIRYSTISICSLSNLG